MNKLALALAAACCALMPTVAAATIETPEARAQAADAAQQAREDMMVKFGTAEIKPNRFLWDDQGSTPGDVNVIVSISDQMAYVYRSGTLVGAAAVSTAKEGKVTPTGIFPVLEKKRMHHSRTYDNAPMPFMQRLDEYGIALHAGHNPGYAASHGCIRLPVAFAQKLFSITDVGSQVMIAA
ncbi:L,D-transpeptidase family protein [Sphingomonas jaspsi]|uniref:L,D-transpeptidase family protein n=1 Tax=Sphingomonas jaspsi TaxID=392409 RepID=UPI0004BB662B|nr:L,D-transpeptidase family protein [Sphingomonas jaspsi]